MIEPKSIVWTKNNRFKKIELKQNIFQRIIMWFNNKYIKPPIVSNEVVKFTEDQLIKYWERS